MILSGENIGRKDKGEKSFSYWENLMDEVPLNLHIPVDYLRAAAEKFSFHYEEFKIPEEIINKTREFVKINSTSFTIVFNTAFSILMARYCNEERMPIACVLPDTNYIREKFCEKRVTGYFTNLSGNITFTELVKGMEEEGGKPAAENSISLDNYITMANDRKKGNYAPIFPFLLWNDTIPTEGDWQLKLNMEFSPECSSYPVFDIILQCISVNNGYSYKLYYNNQIFEKFTIRRIIANYLTLMQSILKNPDNRLFEMEYISSEEKNIILNNFNQKDKNYYTNETIADRLKKQVLCNTDSIIAYEEGITLTLGELDKKTGILAQKLLKSKNKYVGLMTEKGISTVIGLFSILKSGKCVVAINANYPNSRIEFIAKECQLDTIITCEECYSKAFKISENLEAINAVIIAGQEDDMVDTVEYKAGIQPEDPCYVIYTSGTTGNPKGVIITHRNFMILFSWFVEYLKLDENIRSYQNLSYSFDFGMFDVLATVLCGGTLFFNNKKKIGSLKNHIKYINEFGINNICTTPSFFSILASFKIHMPTLKILHLGGEKLTHKHIEQFTNVLAADCNIYNGYGPSECTINNTIYQITVNSKMAEERQKYSSIPIGKPSANNYIYILDDYNKLVPIGVKGELCISGDGLGLGYLNNPALTGKKFQANPIYPEKIMYRSGDVVKWLSDGNIEFIERKDEQVKISGFRIELGEIETYLLNHPLVKKAAVVVMNNEKNIQSYLSAFIETELNLNTVREYLAEYLPYYMIPKHIEIVEDMPLTYNGKIDKKKLLETFINSN